MATGASAEEAAAIKIEAIARGHATRIQADNVRDELKMAVYHESKAERKWAEISRQVHRGLFVPKYSQKGLSAAAGVVQKWYRVSRNNTSLSEEQQGRAVPKPIGPSYSVSRSATEVTHPDLGADQLNELTRALNVAINEALRLTDDADTINEVVGKLLLGETPSPGGGLPVPGGVRARNEKNAARATTPRGLRIEAALDEAVNAAAASGANNLVLFVGNHMLGRPQP